MQMNKKAFDLSLTTIIELVLVLLVILALTSLGVKFGKPFLEKQSDNEVYQQFTALHDAIDNQYTGVFPLSLPDDYAIVGFTADATVLLHCDNPLLISDATLLRKPAVCRDKPCLCLCQSFADVDEEKGVLSYAVDDRLCNPTTGSVRCFLQSDFANAELTFKGGTFADGNSCELAFVGGSDAPQEVYLNISDNTARICEEPCGLTMPPQERSFDVETVPELSHADPKTLEGIFAAYGSFINAAADRYGLDPAFIVAVIYTESRGKSDALSCTGAVGLMQLQPETATMLGLSVPNYPVVVMDERIKKGCPAYVTRKKVSSCAYGYLERCDQVNDERFDPAKNIDASAKYLRQLIEKGKAAGYTAENDLLKYALSCYLGGCNPTKQAAIDYYGPILANRERAKVFTEVVG